MTEAQWLTDNDPERWLYPERVQGRSERKLRLFCVACCRRIWPLLPEWCRLAVDTAEAYADGGATAAALLDVTSGADQPTDLTDSEQAASDAVASTAAIDIRNYVFPVSNCAADAVWIAEQDHRDAELASQAKLLREIFGNPFRPVVFDPTWRTSNVMLLAEGTYEEKAFERLPILADALQDAGCTSEPLLAHLRDPDAPHVRGCWALDLVLAKE